MSAILCTPNSCLIAEGRLTAPSIRKLPDEDSCYARLTAESPAEPPPHIDADAVSNDVDCTQVAAESGSQLLPNVHLPPFNERLYLKCEDIVPKRSYFYLTKLFEEDDESYIWYRGCVDRILEDIAVFKSHGIRSDAVLPPEGRWKTSCTGDPKSIPHSSPSTNPSVA